MIYIFVEGPDDERFFHRIYGKYFVEFKCIQYAGWSNIKINQFIRSIRCISGADYIFFGDADGKAINDKKNALVKKYSNLDIKKVFVVQYEIESWYYAGASQAVCQKLNIRQYVHNTDNIRKEHFNSKLPKREERKIIMASILEMYDLELALTRNTSLSIFNSYLKNEELV